MRQRARSRPHERSGPATVTHNSAPSWRTPLCATCHHGQEGIPADPTAATLLFLPAGRTKSGRWRAGANPSKQHHQCCAAALKTQKWEKSGLACTYPKRNQAPRHPLGRRRETTPTLVQLRNELSKQRPTGFVNPPVGCAGRVPSTGTWEPTHSSHGPFLPKKKGSHRRGQAQPPRRRTRGHRTERGSWGNPVAIARWKSRPVPCARVQRRTTLGEAPGASPLPSHQATQPTRAHARPHATQRY